MIIKRLVWSCYDQPKSRFSDEVVQASASIAVAMQKGIDRETAIKRLSKKQKNALKEAQLL